MRLSGPAAADAAVALAGRLPQPRRATVATLREPGSGAVLDRALIFWLPGPASATGEDIVEFHLHGGRAVIAAVERALMQLPGMRPAEAGEFTRRAFLRGRIDLAQAEGLADLLAAETELQRAAAQAMTSGQLSQQSEAWREGVLRLSAEVEAVLDFSDEDDIALLPGTLAAGCRRLAEEIGGWLDRPRAELLREGFTVVLSGPPNSGKSTLFNALVESETAITSPHPGTTRDAISQTVALQGVPIRFVDTAGWREGTSDPVERIGIARARDAAERADLVLWLGPYGCGPSGKVWEIAARQDCGDATPKPPPSWAVSARTGSGLADLRRSVLEEARASLPRPGAAALNERQHRLLGRCADALIRAAQGDDLLLIAEELRLARGALDSLLGRTGTEAMLDALFGRFCIGK